MNFKGPSQPMCIARRDTISGHFIGRFCLPFECFKIIYLPSTAVIVLNATFRKCV